MVELSKKQLTERFVGLMERMYGQMHSRPPEAWSDLELTMPQVRTLVLLRQGPRRMSDIATYLGTGLSSATSMIDRLVNKHLVERFHDPADRRVVTCRLTVLGKEEMERFWRVSRMQIEALSEILTLQELEMVVHAMEILAAAIGRQAGASPAGASAASGGERESGSGSSGTSV